VSAGRLVRALAALAAVGALVAVPTATGAADLPGAAPFTPALAKRLSAATAAQPADEIRSRHREKDGSPIYTNRLVLETSPYLLQHAHNPVDWRTWSDEAFEDARRLDRPVLVSIGYATCHWCHVMEEESFEDVAIATLLNESFVAIKVDREVRPDVDATYMAAIRELGHSGGWPLNVWLTPDRKPFYAGSYFPPEDRDGQPGFARVLAAVRDLYGTQREKVERDADRLTAAVKRSVAIGTPASQLPTGESLTRAVAAYAALYDGEWGGLRGRIKFPSALPVPLLLRVYRRTGDAQALEMVTHTLAVIARSGVRDQVGGGFHRYATDPRWRVPHFEKMLTDDAWLLQAYASAWQVSGRPEFAEVARDTATALRRELEVDDGGYLSGLDADSGGADAEAPGEGLYYTWMRAELDAALGPEDGALAAAWYGLALEDARVGERAVLQTPRPLAVVAAEAGISEAALAERLAAIRGRLAQARAARPAPLRDTKRLTAWNGFAISALARAGFALGEPDWVASAARAARRLLATRDEDGRLRRVRTGDRVSGEAFLEDYALAIAGLLDLYESEATADPAWLDAALALQERLDADFADDENGGYFRTAAGGEAVLLREKPIDDSGPLPSGNGTAASNLLRLAALTGEDRHAARAQKLLRAFGTVIERAPASVPTLLEALDWEIDGHREVIVVQPATGGDPEPLLAVLRRTYQPNRVQVVVREGDGLAANAERVSLLAGKVAREGRPTAYVCENRSCRFPTTDPAELAKQLAPLPD